MASDGIVEIVDCDTAAQIAIGECADELLVGIDHGGAAIAFAAHLDRCTAQSGIEGDSRQSLVRTHDLLERRQLRTQATARMKQAETVGRKTTSFNQGDSKRIAKNQLHGRR